MRFARIFTLSCFVFLLGSCARPTNEPQAARPAIVFPPFPDDRRASMQTTTRLGTDTYLRSPGAEENGEALLLSGQGSGLEWAIYQFGSTPKPLLVEVELVPSEASKFWLAVADFSDANWSLFGPYAGVNHQPMALLPERHRSQLGNVYLAVVVGAQEGVEVSRVTLLDREPPVASLEGSVLHGFPLEYVTLTAQNSFSADEVIIRYEWDLDSDDVFEFDTGPEATTLARLPPYSIGRSRVGVRVTDSAGLTDTALATLNSRRRTISADARFMGGMKQVNGYPAIVWESADWMAGPGPYKVQYYRAFDATGNVWGPTGVVVTLFEGTTVSGASPPAFEVINGFPAVAYTVTTRNETTQQWKGSIYYRQAMDADGVSWAPATEVVYGEAPAPGTMGPGSLAEVNGRPALVFRLGSSEGPCYVQAQDASGSSWLPHVRLDRLGPSTHFYYNNLLVLQDKPTYISIDGTYRAVDSNGAEWGPGAEQPWYRVGPSVRMQNDVPVMVAQSSPSGIYYFTGSSTGEDWSVVKQLYGTGPHGTSIGDLALDLVKGSPWVVLTELIDIGSYVVLLRSSNPDGTEWSAGEIIDVQQLTNDVEILGLADGAGIAYTEDSAHLPQKLFYDYID